MKRSAARTLLLILGLSLALPAISVAASSLYWLDANYGAPTLNRSDLNGLGVTSVPLTAGTLPEGLAAWADGRVTWTESAVSNARIMGVAHDLSAPVAVVSGQSSLRGIAVDDVNHVLYWTSSNQATGGFVYRKLLNGPATPIVTLAPGANPRGIAVDPANGKILWADLHQVYKANLNGSGVEVVVTTAPGTLIWGVAVNPATQHVYWTEYNTGRLPRTDYFGGGFVNIQTTLSNGTYLAIDIAAGNLYWTEAGVGTQRIRRSSLNGTGLTTLPPVMTTYGGIAIGPGPVSSAGETPPVREFALARPWPNPGAGIIHLAFSLPHATRVRLSVFDVQGREVAVLSDGEMPAGHHDVTWDGQSRNAPAPAGIYFARMAAEGRTWVQRMVLSK